MRTVHEQERQDEDRLDRLDRDALVPDPPRARHPVDPRVQVDVGSSRRELTPHQHRVRRARAALHARRERIRDDARKNRLYRAGVGALGSFVVVLGLALVPLPGPGWLVVFLGLALLGSEFSSAQRLKAFGERHVHAWAQWIQARSLAVRAALATGTAAVVASVLWGYLAWQGVPSWTPEVVTAQLQWVPGL